jgi:hypothetical protein
MARPIPVFSALLLFTSDAQMSIRTFVALQFAHPMTQLNYRPGMRQILGSFL